MGLKGLIAALGLMAFSAQVDAGTIQGQMQFGCQSKRVFKTIMQHAVRHDNDAFRTDLITALYTGNCVMFKEGERAYIMDSELLSGIILVRRAGGTKRYWASMGAVRD